ncbi:DUF2723 domain-containing protein [Pontibacter sp. G13]|uniref:glycosyltransferase family 117 protein n=1 Tax=Pontibacter sp. G13 TaxID=3074898 RepID=UPI00288B47A6|nr:DUF2723 domain-containing protein [Pontibacter sp. G13]WNJ16959.1 DUF2723 domain-containing protein [Pontibacter sp. G13]
MDYRKINNLTGWGSFIIAMVVYLMTMAPTASYWDCGEFIACSNELEVPHPPGAPLFLLIGRLFAMFGSVISDDPATIAWMLNLMSALASAFTVLFTFWITTHLAKRMMVQNEGTPNSTQTLVIMGAGMVAALANTFADSFWFNAVEAEVYAMSSFFTAIVVWLMFKWEERADEPRNERWIILIAYLMGMSIGVHLLNLLTIPALAFLYYFRKHEFTWQGFIVTGLISVAILGVIQSGIIVYTFDIAWFFETIFSGIQEGAFTSGMGLPMGTGLVIFAFLLVAALVGLTIYSVRTQNTLLNTIALCVVVIYIGFSSYMMIPIRSGANPPIDENNPENTQTFLSYMKREQYGNRPLVYGPLYNARPNGLETTGKEYAIEEGNNRYVELGDKRAYTYADRDKKFFPRMYERSRYDAGRFGYKNFVKNQGANQQDPMDDRPTKGEDFSFFINYQVIHMYWRYFMWNFAGRESDVQDAGWESGFAFNKTKQMPDFMKHDPSKNHFFFIPLLMGLLGLFWQSSKRGSDAAIVALLFFFTGLAIILYLNQYPNQPRERDYSFAGSFQTFAIWIGLGTVALYQLLEKYLKGTAAYLAVGLAMVAPVLMGAQGWDDHSRKGRYIAPESAYNLLNSLAKNAVLFTNGDNDTFPLWYLQEVEGVRTDVRVLCLSYVNTDWYINQMYEQMNESPALPLSLKAAQYSGQANQSKGFGAKKTLAVQLPVNTQALLQSGIISEAEVANVVSPMRWNVGTRGGGQNRYLELKDILILNLLENVANGNWERPVYFANTVSPGAFLNLQPFLRQEGLAYRILPIKNTQEPDPFDPTFRGSLDHDRMEKNLTEVFKYTNLDNPDVYYDENIRRMLGNYYYTFTRLASDMLRKREALMRVNNEMRGQLANGGNADSIQTAMSANSAEIQSLNDRATRLMDFTYEKFPFDAVTPDPYSVLRVGIIYDRLGDREKADMYYDFVQKRSIETLKYYSATGDPFRKTREYYFPLQLLGQQFAQTGRAEKLNTLQAQMSELNMRNLGLQ